MKAFRHARLSVLAAFVCGPALADERADYHPFLSNDFIVSAGIFAPREKLTLSVSGTIPGIDTEIGASRDFGIGDADPSLSGELLWRFGEKWSLRLQTLRISESKERTLGSDVEWGDLVFDGSSRIAVGNSLSVGRVFFGRRMSINDDSEFGLGLGLHWLRTRAFIEGNVIVNGGDNEFRSEEVEAEGPMPNLGIWYTWSPSPKWAVISRLDWLSASVDPYDGYIVNLSVGANYQISEHVGIGLNYNHFELDVAVSDNNWRGELNMQVNGPFAYISVNW